MTRRYIFPWLIGALFSIPITWVYLTIMFPSNIPVKLEMIGSRNSQIELVWDDFSQQSTRLNPQLKPAFHQLVIDALGEKDARSTGTEVWLRGISKTNGDRIAYSALNLGNLWEIQDRMPVSKDHQPAILTWQGITDGIKLEFTSHSRSGKAAIWWDDERQLVDLYSPIPQSLFIDLPTKVDSWAGELPAHPIESLRLRFGPGFNQGIFSRLIIYSDPPQVWTWQNVIHNPSSDFMIKQITPDGIQFSTTENSSEINIPYLSTSEYTPTLSTIFVTWFSSTFGISFIILIMIYGYSALLNTTRKMFILKKAFSSLLNLNFLIVIIVTLVGMGNLFWGEIQPVSGGFGWDGLHYKAITQKFPEIIYSGDLQTYYAARIVPSILVNLGLRFFQFPLEDFFILKGFQIYNLVLLIAGSILWGHILDELRIGYKGKWLAFIGLYINVAIAKLYFYEPPLTDQTAFFLGIALLYFFLKQNYWGLLGVTIVGAFTWNILIYCGLILFVFSSNDGGKFDLEAARFHFNRMGAFLLTGIVLLVILIGYWQQAYDKIPGQTLHSVIPLSILIAGMYTFFGSLLLLDTDYLFNFKHLLKTVKPGRIVVAIAIFVMIRFLVNAIGPISNEYLNPINLLNLMFQATVQYPGLFILAHIVRYGPIIFVTLFLWGDFSRLVHSYGVGLTIFMIFNFLLSIGTESRWWINSFPFVVAFTVKAAEKLNWPISYYWVIGVLSLIMSKIWLRMNAEPWSRSSPIFEFPAQYLFMNSGPFMSFQMYLIQGFFVLLTGLILLFLIYGPTLIQWSRVDFKRN